MAKRLVKIAKELNVGTATIVEHLVNSGFEIENKPTAKVSEEMYSELLKEFSKSIAIKEQADQLVIGNRPTTKKEGSSTPPTTIVESPESIPEKKEAPKKEEPVQKEPPKTEKEPPKKEVPKEETPKEESPKVQLKIKGKIDLDNKNKKTPPKKEVPPEEKKEKQQTTPASKEESQPAELKEESVSKDKPATKKSPKSKPDPEKSKKEKPVQEEKVVDKDQQEKPITPTTENQSEEESKPKKVDSPKKASTSQDGEAQSDKEVSEEKSGSKRKTKAPASKQKEEEVTSEGKSEEGKGDEDELIRAKTPQLKGLKILGKIDTDKLSKKKKKKKKDSPKDQPSKSSKQRTDRKGKSGDASEAGSSGDKKQEGAQTSSDDPRKKRKRKRKKITRTTIRGGRDSSGSSRNRSRRKKDEVKEVSKKEIEEQIKATMARMSKGGKKKRQRIRRETRERLREKQEQRQQEAESDKLQLTEFVTVSELASLMNVGVTEVITTCMNLGVIVSINQRLDAEIIELVAEEYGHEVEFITAEESSADEFIIEEDDEDAIPRSPIVTVMGHVDHGKTSLLDYIRTANVVQGEAGGITQHIGAYEVKVGEDDRRITFLDTPGHEAFTAMRARGAKVTDVAVIIIAADDRIMPQTKEAISHAQAAGVPIVFAINKIDKPDAEPERIKQELANMNLLVEEWGGKYQSQDISAKSGTNIDQLLEKILLEAELLELKANPERMAIGTVLEASLDKGRGYVTKMLVQNGTLDIGDSIVAGEYSGKIKAMFNERGNRVESVGPSTPVLVLGLGGAPQAGEKFKETENEPEARQIASKRAQIAREQSNRANKRISLDEIGRRLALGAFKELNLIVKGDVDGSIEALSDSLIKLSQETVQVNVIHKAVGQIIESDVLLASASDAIIIGFQVRPSLNARKLAEREGVQIKTYSIIYEAIDEVKAAIEGMLEPTKEENIVCQLEVREVYKISKVGTVAGCYVQEGKIARSTKIRVIRNGIVIYPTKENVVGELSSLKRFKDDAKEVKAGMECGVAVKNFNDIKVGDNIEGYEIVEIKQTLDL